jgi:peptidoglycan-associated lipoprotein
MAEAREVFQTIYFPLDQSVLDAKARTILTGIRKFMNEHPEVAFTVSGHCDERGTGEYNLALGEQRARAITRYLADLGVPDSRMKTLSYGEERPASEGHSESSWALNRRAEFTPEFRFELSGTQP